MKPFVQFFTIAGSLFLSGIFTSFTVDSHDKDDPPLNTGILEGAYAPVKALPDNPISAGYYIVIDKSDYELKVYDAVGWYATYPIVFGSKDLGDKMREGDKRTPEGSFKVIQKKLHSKWSYELLLDYPNEESFQRFKVRRQQGAIPATAKIGGGIAIHATRPEEEWTVDNYYNWTDGCISLKYSEMKDLYSYISVGTQVTIKQ